MMWCVRWGFKSSTFHNYHCFYQKFTMMKTIILLLFLEYVSSVKIVRHWISQSVDSTNKTTSIIMDCDYQYEPSDIKLVIRWFYNDSPEPIYQWIPESGSRYVGEIIRQYFDENFQIDKDQLTKFRAIRLIPQQSPTNQNFQSFPLNLSGNYTCVISSIMNQDSRQGNLVLYVPPSKFEFNIFAAKNDLDITSEMKKNHHNEPLIRCSAEDVYPKPTMTFSELYSMSSSFHSTYHQTPTYMPPFYTFPTINILSVMNETTELFTSWFEYRLRIDSIKVGTIYECRLEIPATNYMRKKRIKLIYPSTYYATGSSWLANRIDGSNNNHKEDNLWLRQHQFDPQQNRNFPSQQSILCSLLPTLSLIIGWYFL